MSAVNFYFVDASEQRSPGLESVDRLVGVGCVGVQADYLPCVEQGL